MLILTVFPIFRSIFFAVLDCVEEELVIGVYVIVILLHNIVHGIREFCYELSLRAVHNRKIGHYKEGVRSVDYGKIVELRRCPAGLMRNVIFGDSLSDRIVRRLLEVGSELLAVCAVAGVGVYLSPYFYCISPTLPLE